MISRLLTAWKTRHLTPVTPQERVEVARSVKAFLPPSCWEEVL